MNRSETCNYADNTTIYACISKIKPVLDSLEQDATRISAWYPENYMKLNVDKFNSLIFGEKSGKVKIHIRETVLEVAYH